MKAVREREPAPASGFVGVHNLPSSPWPRVTPFGSGAEVPTPPGFTLSSGSLTCRRGMLLTSHPMSTDYGKR